MNINFSPVTSRLSYGNLNNKGFSAYNAGDNPSFNKFQEDKLHDKEIIKNDNASFAIKDFAYGVCGKNQDENGVSKVFFSEENIKRIQKMIKREVFLRTNKQFRLDDDQDESDLLVAMRAIYLEESRNLPFQIIKQVKLLNRKVVGYIVPDMITEIKQSYAYIREINEPIKPIDRPVNVTHAGRKTLPAITSIWGV